MTERIDAERAREMIAAVRHQKTLWREGALIATQPSWFDGITDLAETVIALTEERDAAIATLAEAEQALLEAQNERQDLRDRLDVYEPPYRPRKFS